MSKSNPVWKDLLKARPSMTEEDAKRAASLLSHVRVSMVRRCTNPQNKDYPRYGGRGISVCPEWSDPKSGYRAFAVWAIKNGWKPGLTVERNDNNYGYSPNNCRFASRVEQCYNRSTNKSINLDVPVKVLHSIIRLNTENWRKLLSDGKTAIEDELVKVRERELDKVRNRKERLYKGCCPVCGEQTTNVYRNKAGNGRLMVIGCPHCIQTTDIYDAAVYAGVFD